MGIFDFFKKSKPQTETPEESDTMLTLGKRPEPLKKDGAKSLEETADGTSMPVISRKLAEPEEGHSHIEKGREILPHVEKLNISLTDENPQSPSPKATAAPDSPLKQVSLTPQTSLNAESPDPGERLMLPLKLLLPHLSEDCLSSEAANLAEKELLFTKAEILSILSRGVFSVMGKALLERLPPEALSGKQPDDTEIFEIPLDNILPLIPMDWFVLSGQLDTQAETLKNIEDPFSDMSVDAKKEKPALPPEEESTLR